MSLRQFEKLLHLKPKASRLLLAVLLSLHITALLCVAVAVPSYQIIFWLLAALIILSCLHSIKKYIFFTHPQSIISVTQTRQGDWSLGLYNGELIDADLCDDSYKHPLLVVLNFKTKQGRFGIPLFPDSLDDDLHRQLRCRLTLSRPAEKEKLLRR